MSHIIAAGTKCKLKNKSCGRLNGFEVGETVVVLSPDGCESANNPIRVTHLPGVNDGHDGYCSPAQLEILHPQPSDTPKKFSVGQKVRVVKLIADAPQKVKLGDICTVSKLRDEEDSPRNVVEHGCWNFRPGVFEPVEVTPFDDEIARMEAALADLKAKALASIGPVWEKAKSENVGKFHFLRESGRVMVLRRRDADGQAYFVEFGKGDTHSPFEHNHDSDCRLATRAEILDSGWIPAE